MCVQESILETLPALTSSFILHGSFSWDPFQLSSDHAEFCSSKIYPLCFEADFQGVQQDLKLHNTVRYKSRLSLTEVLQSRFSWLVSGKSRCIWFLDGTENLCVRKESSMHSRRLMNAR